MKANSLIQVSQVVIEFISNVILTGLLKNNYKVKSFMGINLPKEVFVLASNLELGEAIGQGKTTAS